MFQASNESQPDEITTESSEWKVVGFANRTTSPPKIISFSDPFPIFEAEKEETSVEGQESGKKIYPYKIIHVMRRGPMQFKLISVLFKHHSTNNTSSYPVTCFTNSHCGDRLFP